jgi:hypothetical protein
VSNSLAVGAVTATLYRLLSRTNTPLPGDPLTGDPLSDAQVSTKSPDKARDPQESYNQVNVFLYQVEYNAALRNMPMPGAVKSGESAVPPVALVLNYLLTFYGRSADDVLAHRLLGRTLSILNDNSHLAAADIDAAMPGSDLARQIERVRLTPMTMSTEEMSRLWTAFQTQYRTSVAYQASVVLIDSTQATKAGPPVLSRGAADRGPQVAPNLSISVPTLATVVIPAGRPSAWLGMGGGPGDVITLIGSNLAGAVTVIIADADGNPTVVPTTSSGANTVTFTLPDDASGLTAGVYTVSLSIVVGARTYATNGLTFSIAPRITISPNPAARDASGNVALNVTVSPPVLDSQRVSLLVGATEVRPAAFSVSTTSLAFTLENADAGSFPTRLRVDGVDSLAVAYTTPATIPPAWDPTQITVIT